MKLSPYLDTETAATLSRLAVPHHFAVPARDLLAALKPPVGGFVLDVGSGTGAGAIHAAEEVGPDGLVVALDPSGEMLRLLGNPQVLRVVGEVPGLPFPEDYFHTVMANFVLSHFKSYEHGLVDMVRVLAPGGRLGVTVWAAGKNQFAETWSEAAAVFLSREQLQQAFREFIPWDEWFSQEGNLRRDGFSSN